MARIDRMATCSPTSTQSTLLRAARALTALQHPDGYWKGELETNVTIDAEDLFFAHFLGLERPGETRASARWIREHQRRDGSGRPSTAAPATSRRASRPTSRCASPATPRAPSTCARAAAFIRDAGGVESTRVFTRMWLALLGALVVGGGADAAARADPAPAAGAALGLLLRLLGAPDDRRALGRHRAPARRPPFGSGSTSCAPGAGRAGRPTTSGGALPAARPAGAPLRRRARPAAAARARCARRALDRRAPGARRLLGRDPAAVGLVDRRAARSRLRARPPGDRARARGLDTFTIDDDDGPRASRPASRRSGTPRSR